jgi:hypothetical protein
MSIRVICPSCHASFNVSDQFAGKEGPCPKCKTKIKIPDQAEEVVVHAPDAYGPKDSAGRSVLRPVARTETNFSWIYAVAIGVAVLAAFIIAAVLRTMEDVPVAMIVLAAVALGPTLSVGGYSFLRSEDLEPYRGTGLLVRALICGLVYAILWGVYGWAVKDYLFDGDIELLQSLLVVTPMVIVGGLVAAGCFEIEFGNGCLHYALYLGVTVLLRMAAGIGAF